MASGGDARGSTIDHGLASQERALRAASCDAWRGLAAMAAPEISDCEQTVSTSSTDHLVRASVSWLKQNCRLAITRCEQDLAMKSSIAADDVEPLHRPGSSTTAANTPTVPNLRAGAPAST
jgi:hypothetical protein